MARRPHPRRGEVWIVDFGYVVKTRPCVILNVDLADEDRVIVACVPRTTSIRGTRFEVPIKAKFFDEEGVFDAKGILNAPVVKCLRKLGDLTPEQIAEIEVAIKHWLGLD